MLGNLLVVSLIVACSQTAPLAGPNYDNIQYLHNFTLTYSNNTLDGLGQIDNMTDVNSEMAENLKSAINLALPGYLASSRSSTSFQTTSSSSSSTAMPEIQSSTQMPARKKRQVTSSTPSTGSDPSTSTSTSTSQPSNVISTTQPYGTDEEFYARTDLVHFHVDINDLEGSGVSGLNLNNLIV